MTGQQIIAKIKSAIVFQNKGNEIIEWLNRQWTVQLPDTQFGTVEFKSGDKSVVLDATQLSVITFIACDDQGNQVTFTTFGFQGTPAVE